MRYTKLIITLIIGFAMDMAAEGITADSIFIQNSRPIKFVVNRISISDQDREWITDVLIPELQRLGDRGIVFGRATASPEGPYDNNRRLANQRRASVDALLRSYGIGTDHIQYDVVAEDYDLLYTMMMLKHDAKFHDVDSLITLYADDTQRLKAAMKRHDGGKLWRYLLKEYFPKLRAVRIIVVDKRLANIDSNDLAPRPIAATIPATVADCHLRIQNADITPAYIIPATTPASALPRREVLSVKTNVLFDFAYMPGYDRFCPIPNVALEYFRFMVISPTVQVSTARGGSTMMSINIFRSETISCTPATICAAATSANANREKARLSEVYTSVYTRTRTYTTSASMRNADGKAKAGALVWV